MLGLSFDKLLLVGFVAAILLGPERLPEFASRLRLIVARAKELLDGTQSRIREEMGPEFDEVDWRKLDPRQYDPRRIMREALSGEVAPSTSEAVRVGKPPGTRETLQSEHGESATDQANMSPMSIGSMPAAQPGGAPDHLPDGYAVVDDRIASATANERVLERTSAVGDLPARGNGMATAEPNPT